MIVTFIRASDCRAEYSADIIKEKILSNEIPRCTKKILAVRSPSVSDDADRNAGDSESAEGVVGNPGVGETTSTDVVEEGEGKEEAEEEEGDEDRDARERVEEELCDGIIKPDIGKKPVSPPHRRNQSGCRLVFFGEALPDRFSACLREDMPVTGN